MKEIVKVPEPEKEKETAKEEEDKESKKEAKKDAKKKSLISESSKIEKMVDDKIEKSEKKEKKKDDDEDSSSNIFKDIKVEKPESLSGDVGEAAAAASNAIAKVGPKIAEIAKKDPKQAKYLLDVAKKTAIDASKAVY